MHNLGLGLELDFDRPRTPTPVLRQNFSFENDEFRRFDGEWGSKGVDNGGLDSEWNSNLMRNVTVRKRTKRKPYIVNKGNPQDVLDEYLIPATNATELLREYGVESGAVNRVRDDRSGRPRDRSVRRQSGPGKMAVAETATPDVRRFSTMSMPNSEVIEAVVVVNSTPSRRKTLRHMKKQYALRDFSAGHSATAPLATNGVSTDVSRRLSNKTMIPDRQHLSVRTNATTQPSASTRSRRRILADGHIPVIVVPERRSSSKPARAPSLRSASSRHSKKTASLRSAPLSQSAGSNIPGTFEQPTIRQRRMSDSAASCSGSQRTTNFPPAIPARSSSLSAPTSRHTSRNTSRAGSLTAESLRAHNFTQALEAAKLGTNPVVPFSSPKDSSSHRHTALTVDTTSDAPFGQRLSAQVTPFSQASYDTHLTALEIAEAQAVNLYPHQNTSVLMVEHSTFGGGGGPSAAPSGSRELPPAAEPATPPQPPPKYEPLAVDSPLRNPRAAPVPTHPPLINFIPATPAALSPAADDQDKQLGHPAGAPAARPATADGSSGPPPRRSMSLLRRALSNRRRRHSADHGWGAGAGADSTPRHRFSLRRRRQVDEATQTDAAHRADASTAAYPTVADQPPDESRLHPFWRPARFWDDLEGEEGDCGYGEEDDVETRRGFAGRLKRTFAILPAGSRSGGRRTGGRRSVGEAWGVRGVRVSWVGVAGLAGLRRRVSEGRWRGGERRRERRREGLRRSISAPWGARDGVEEVLRGRGGMGGGV